MTRWLACYRVNPRAKLRLFCFPYAGGGAHIFRSWPEGLSADLEVCPVQLPGRGTRMREQAFSKLEPLIELLGEALLTHLDMPFAFFGHSLGAKVAYEMARHLEKENKPRPVYLFVSGSRAVHLPRTEPPTYNLPDLEFLENLRSLNGISKEAFENVEIMRLMLPVLRADVELVQTYVYTPGPVLGCPILALGGLQDQSISRQQIEAWRELTSNSFRLEMLPGDHFFISTSQTRLLQIINRELVRP